MNLHVKENRMRILLKDFSKNENFNYNELKKSRE